MIFTPSFCSLPSCAISGLQRKPWPELIYYSICQHQQALLCCFTSSTVPHYDILPARPALHEVVLGAGRRCLDRTILEMKQTLSL